MRCFILAYPSPPNAPETGALSVTCTDFIMRPTHHRSTAAQFPPNRQLALSPTFAECLSRGARIGEQHGFWQNDPHLLGRALA